jgi:hypothetical protein
VKISAARKDFQIKLPNPAQQPMKNTVVGLTHYQKYRTKPKNGGSGRARMGALIAI